MDMIFYRPTISGKRFSNSVAKWLAIWYDASHTQTTGAIKMARFMAVGYKLNTGKVQEMCPGNYNRAFSDAMEMLNSGQYKVIIILRDSEGEDCIENAGKFFLHRIIK